MKVKLIILLILISSNTFSQSDFNSIKKQKLTPIQIDIENEKIFVYIKPNAILYFRSNDVIHYLDSIYNIKGNIKTSYLYDTLLSSQRKIEILDYNYSYGNDEREKLIEKNQIDKKYQSINKEFEYIGFNLILQGKFMVYSKVCQSFLFDNLKAVKSDGLFGTKYLDFIFPDKLKFYSTIIALGE